MVVCQLLVLCVLMQQPLPPEAPPPTVGAIVQAIPEDLWRFISLDTAVTLALGGVAAGAAHVFDDDLAAEVETNVALNNALAPGHTYGAFATQVAVGVGIYVVGRAGDKSRLAVTGADIMRAQILSQLWVQALKYTVQRERPDGSNNHSFPSGHTASGFASAAVIGRHYGWKAGVPALTVAGYVAFCRVKDNKHYLSDVVFGAAMGIAAERTVSFHSRRYGIVVTPRATRGGAAIMFQVPEAVLFQRR